jgi:hypothetical protein
MERRTDIASDAEQVSTRRADAAPLRAVELLTVALVWLFFGALNVATSILEPHRGPPPFDVPTGVNPRVLINPVVWAALTVLILWLSRRVSLDRTFWRRRWLVVVLGAVLAANVAIDPQSLTRSSRGQVAGIVYAEVAGVPFPERQWSDSVVVVLSSWLESLNALVTHASDTASLRFRDGPFRLELTRYERSVHVNAVDSRRNDVVVVQTESKLDLIRTATARAASQLLWECSEKSWWSPDIDHLVLLTKQATA